MKSRTDAAVIRDLNARFYAACGRRGIVPNIGPDFTPGPPPADPPRKALARLGFFAAART